MHPGSLSFIDTHTLTNMLLVEITGVWTKTLKGSSQLSLKTLIHYVIQQRDHFAIGLFVQKALFFSHNSFTLFFLVTIFKKTVTVIHRNTINPSYNMIAENISDNSFNTCISTKQFIFLPCLEQNYFQ